MSCSMYSHVYVANLFDVTEITKHYYIIITLLQNYYIINQCHPAHENGTCHFSPTFLETTCSIPFRRLNLLDSVLQWPKKYSSQYNNIARATFTSLVVHTLIKLAINTHTHTHTSGRQPGVLLSINHSFESVLV